MVGRVCLTEVWRSTTSLGMCGCEENPRPSTALGKAGWLSGGGLEHLCTLVSLGRHQEDWGEGRFLHCAFKTSLQVNQDLIS